MRRRALAVSLIVVGLGLMSNPLYLPAAVAETTPQYVHAVGPTDASVPEYGADDVVAYEDLPADARELFDRALTDEENTHVVTDPTASADSLSYPAQPTLGDGLTIVAYEGAEYAFWTYTTEAESGFVLVQRVVLQPALFLIGFFTVFAGVAVWWQSRATAE